VIVTTIHMGYQSVLFFPTKEKLEQAKTIFHNVFVEKGVDHFSTGFVGTIVNPFLLILTQNIRWQPERLRLTCFSFVMGDIRLSCGVA
jgi:hypothetical protein